MACAGPASAQKTAYLCWTANIKKQHLKGEGVVMEMQEDPLEVMKLVRCCKFSKNCLFLCQPCNQCSTGKETAPGCEWSDHSRAQMTWWFSKWQVRQAICQIYCVLWTGKFCVSSWTMALIKIFSALLLKGNCHHGFNNLGSVLCFGLPQRRLVL